MKYLEIIFILVLLNVFAYLTLFDRNPIPPKTYELDTLGYDTLWYKYDTVITKHFSVEKPKYIKK